VGPLPLPAPLAPGGIDPGASGPGGFVPGGFGSGGRGPLTTGASKTEPDRDRFWESPQAALRASGRSAERAEALKKDNDTANRYAKECADAFDAEMDQYLKRSSKPGVANPKSALPAPKNGSKQHDPERSAIQQVRGAVNVAVPPLVVREFAAPRRAPVPLSEDDSPDTILWQPVIVLPADGKATLTFHLGGAPGGYQVVVAGHTADGRLGAIRGFIPVARAATLAPAGQVAPAAPTVVPAPPVPVPPPMP
jgi:hypothetical protein